MSKIKFSDGIPERRKEHNKIIYPEELLDKKCGGCVRCEKRERAFPKAQNTGWHCAMQEYETDISPGDKACVYYWDRAKHDEIERLHAEDIEKRRAELWEIYAKEEPIKLSLVHDGYGFIPECPICGEMPYNTEQCHWCGQRFVQDEEIREYAEPKTEEGTCLRCGGKVTVRISKYNGHKSYICECCGARMQE